MRTLIAVAIVVAVIAALLELAVIAHHLREIELYSFEIREQR